MYVDCLQFRSSSKVLHVTQNIAPYTCRMALSQNSVSVAIGAQQVSGPLIRSDTDD